MLFSRKRTQSFHLTLHIAGSQLEQVDSFKYLGILLSSNLSWSHHITTIVSKVKRLIGMMYRNFSKHTSAAVMLQIYKSVIRPHLEYACQVWDPHLLKDIQLLEGTHKFALKVCTGNWSSDYTELLNITKVPSLKNRRTYLKLCTLFRISHGINHFPPHLSYRSNSSRHTHSLTLFQPRGITNAYQFSFIPDTIHSWNLLPYDILSCDSVSSFKLALSHYLFL